MKRLVALPKPESREQRIRRETCAGLRALREQLDGLSTEEVDQLKSANPQPRQLPAPRE